MNVMQTTTILKRTLTNPYFSLACFLAVWFVLPRFGGVAVMVGCAGILSAFISAQPERFRSRSGSMLLATGLVIAMWIAAAVVTALTLGGALHG